MPLTFPSHAAAVLPLMRWKALPPAALIVGTCAPDLPYLFDVRSANWHLWPEVPLCVPVGLGVYVLIEWIVLPMLARTLRPWAGVGWPEVFTTRGLPIGWRGWAGAVAAIVLGACTHLIWDGFTHHYRFPASALYPDLTIAGHRFSQWLQLLSSVLGIGLMAVALRKFPVTLARPPSFPLRTLTGALAVGVALAMADFFLRHGINRAALVGTAWHLFWSTQRGVAVGLLFAAGLERLSRRPRSSAPAPGELGRSR